MRKPRSDVFDGVDTFLADRRAAMTSWDIEKVVGFAKKHRTSLANADTSDAEQVEVIWVSVHKARTAMMDLTTDERLLSSSWLRNRGYTSFGDETELQVQQWQSDQDRTFYDALRGDEWLEAVRQRGK